MKETEENQPQLIFVFIWKKSWSLVFKATFSLNPVKTSVSAFRKYMWKTLILCIQPSFLSLQIYILNVYYERLFSMDISGVSVSFEVDRKTTK